VTSDPTPSPPLAPVESTARLEALEAEVRELRRKLTASENALVHTEKLKALGQLISGVAHELANPLTAMIARAALVQTATTVEAARKHAEIIEAQGHRATRIVRNLSSFSRRRTPTHAAVQLNDVVQSVVDFHGYQLDASQIRLVQDLEPGIALVQGDPHELEQVLLNLVTNAQHAMVQARGAGTLTIRTRATGDVVRLSVEDDGPGIPPMTLARVFEPFYSTKGEGGTGLGLAIASDLVKRHGGRLRAESVEGEGTIMTIELPPARAAAEPPVAPAPTGRGGRGLLLIVDDEPEIGQIIADLARRRGYEAEYVESAAEALSRLDGTEFRGILTDLRMPGMDGMAFWEELRRARPAQAMRTIFMTAHHARPETAALLEATGQPCLPKPFRADELDEVLATLDGPARP